MPFDLYAFAPNIKNYSGHPYTYHCHCQNVIEALDGRYHAYIQQESPIDPLPLRWRNHFPSPSEKHFFKKQARAFFKKKPQATFFIETFTRREFKAFALGALIYGKKEDGVWILFRDDHIWKNPKDRRTVQLLTKLLKLKYKNRLYYLTDSSSIATFLEQKLKTSFVTLPLPVTIEHPKPFSQPSTRRLLFIGEPRKEKGLKQVLRLAQQAAPSFTLTCSEAITFDHPKLSITTHPTKLDEKSYNQLLLDHDVLLLPYDRRRYQRRTSGIFVEAIWGGTIPLVTSDTWMSEELKQHDLSELIVDFTRPDFFSHVEQLLSRPKLYPKLARMQKLYQKTHTPESFQYAFSKIKRAV